MTQKEKAVLAWQALTAILTLKKEVSVSQVDEHLKMTPKPHVIAVQFILIGSGCATEELILDGDYGIQSRASIVILHKEAH